MYHRQWQELYKSRSEGAPVLCHSLHCTHTLNLVVKDAVEATPGAAVLFEQFASAVEFFHRSSRAASKLAEEIPKHEAIIR